MYPHQAERLGEALARAEVDVLVATSAANVLYLAGVTGLAASVDDSPQFAVFGPQGIALVAPAVDAVAMVGEGVAVDYVACYGDVPAAFGPAPGAAGRRVQELLGAAAAGPVEALASALDMLGVRSGAVGVDESRLSSAVWQRLAERLRPIELRPAAGQFDEARRVKGPYEIDCAGRALHVAEEALDAVIQVLGRGMTERAAAALYAGEVVKRDAVPLPAIVAMGHHTWLPAPWPSDRELRTGEIVRLDVGCAYKGYWGRVARTAVLGEPTPASEAAYLAIHAALESATAAAAPGVPAGRLVEAAESAARKGGLDGFACQVVGHGIGLAPRERPELSRDTETPLEAGEVICVALAQHDIGSMGVSVRETLLITSGGARSLNRSRHDLVVLD